MAAHANPLFQQPWPEGEFRFLQLGFIVEDIVAAATKWARVFGVGPFHLRPRSAVACTYRGNASTFDMQVGIAQAGPVQIELIAQFDDAPSVIRDIFPTGSEGFHQMCTVTPDYDGKRKHYESLGYVLACEIQAGTQRVGYFDTYADFGFVTEVVEGGENYFARWAQVAKTCENWDGVDPIRHG